MNKKLKTLIEQIKNKEHLGKLVIAFGMIGMVLILASELFAPEPKDVSKQPVTGGSISDYNAQNSFHEIVPNTYQVNLEEQLTNLIQQMEGAGDVCVMITIASSESVVYAQDITQSDTQKVQNHVLLKDGTALTSTIQTPKVCGVAILCQGADDIVLVSKITSLITALFDISSNHVSIEKMK